MFENHRKKSHSILWFASKASYFYILSGQKVVLKMRKMVHFETVLPEWSFLVGKMWENAKIKMRHFRKFSNSVQRSKSGIRHFICRYLSIRGSIHRKKMVKNGKIEKRHFQQISNIVQSLRHCRWFLNAMQSFWVPKLDKLHYFKQRWTRELLHISLVD